MDLFGFPQWEAAKAGNGISSAFSVATIVAGDVQLG
jgi:hypothetical protein